MQDRLTTRPTLLVVCALSVAWITIATVYLYPGVKEEVDEKRYLHRVEKLHTKTATSFERTDTRKGAG